MEPKKRALKATYQLAILKRRQTLQKQHSAALTPRLNKMMITRKSQAALEFLMTYGWAILVVLVAIGALAYFGVLSPDKFLPAKCQLPAGIACTDFKIDNGGALGVGTKT